jgi:hypothetical protein
MMARPPFPIAFLVLAACQPAAERDAPEPAVSSTPAEPTPALSGNAVPPEQLAGEYRVAGVGGQGIDLPYGITASITADRIHLTADCVNVEWGYTMDADGSLSTLRVPTEGCARGLNEIEEALVEAFDGAERVSRTASNGYEFSGRGPTATLFTQ